MRKNFMTRHLILYPTNRSGKSQEIVNLCDTRYSTADTIFVYNYIIEHKMHNKFFR